LQRQALLHRELTSLCSVLGDEESIASLLRRRLSSRSVRDCYIAAAKATLEYALGQDWIKTNPAASIKVRVNKAPKREKELTIAEATTILKATPAKPPAGMSLEMAAARRWIPWICAYTGARVNEITHALQQSRGIKTVVSRATRRTEPWLP
jgi:integrase